MKVIVQDVPHLQFYLDSLSVGWVKEAEVVDAQFAAGMREVESQHPEEAPAEQKARALARLIHRQHAKPLVSGPEGQGTATAVSRLHSRINDLATQLDKAHRESKVSGDEHAAELVSAVSASGQKVASTVEMAATWNARRVDEATATLSRRFESLETALAWQAKQTTELCIAESLRSHILMKKYGKWAFRLAIAALLLLLALTIGVWTARAQVDIVRVQDEGVTIKQWAGGVATFNFTGAGATCTYSAVTLKVTCNVTGGAGGITTLNTLTAATQTFAIGTTGTAPNWASATSTHTLHIPMAATATVTAGLLSKTDYDIFNGKESVLTFSNGVTRAVNAITCDVASGSIPGCLAAADWTTFNGKQDALGFTPANSTVTLTAGAGLGGGGDLTTNRSFATASGETDFLASGALVCGASTQGKAQVHTTPFQYCDNAATPTLRYAAYGDATGNASVALTGDSATSFFSTGILESAVGGTGNGFVKLAGPTTTEKTWTGPDASTTLLTTAAAVTIAQGGTGTASTLTGLVRGSASAMTAAELSQDATTSGSNAVTLAAKFKTGEIVCYIGATNGVVVVDADDMQDCFPNDLGFGITITQVKCYCDGGSPTVMVQRNDGSAADSLTGNLTCTTSGGTGTIDTNEDNFANTDRLDVLVVSAGGVAKRIVVTIRYTVD